MLALTYSKQILNTSKNPPTNSGCFYGNDGAIVKETLARSQRKDQGQS